MPVLIFAGVIRCSRASGRITTSEKAAPIANTATWTSTDAPRAATSEAGNAPSETAPA